MFDIVKEGPDPQHWFLEHKQVLIFTEFAVSTHFVIFNDWRTLRCDSFLNKTYRYLVVTTYGRTVQRPAIKAEIFFMDMHSFALFNSCWMLKACLPDGVLE